MTIQWDERLLHRGSCLLLAAAVLLLVVPIGARDLWAPDEPRYAAIAEEMRSWVHGPSGLLLLHLNGEPYTQKPPLYYWLASAFGAPLGRVTESAARIPSSLSGLAVTALTLRFGTQLFGPLTGLLGAALLLTTFRFAFLSQRVQLDALLTLLEMVALLAFWRLERGQHPHSFRLRVLFHVALGLAVLTKGPVGFLVPALVIAVHLGWEGRWSELRRLFPPWGLLLSLGPGLAWLGAATALAPPGYLQEAVGNNLFGRFFEGTSHGRPFYYYFYQFPVDLLPWTLLLPLAALGARTRLARESAATDEVRRIRRFLGSWIVVPFVFFSLSGGKRGLYLLPVFPAAALVTAHFLLTYLRARGTLPRGFRWTTALLAALLGAAALTLLSIGEIRGVTVPPAFSVSILGALSLGFVVWRLGVTGLGRSLRPLLALLVSVYVIELSVFTLLFPAFDGEKSPRPIARAAAALTPDGRPVGLVGNRALAGGLVYYGDRPVRQLDSAERIREFVASGGTAIVVAARKLDRVEAITAVEVRARARSGRRALLVVSPRPTRGSEVPGPS